MFSNGRLHRTYLFLGSPASYDSFDIVKNVDDNAQRISGNHNTIKSHIKAANAVTVINVMYYLGEIFMEAKDILLMAKDSIVMRINFDEDRYDIISEKLMPWQLKNGIRKMEGLEGTKRRTAERQNYNNIIGYLASRVLPLSRSNAKWILNAMRISQAQDPMTRAKTAIACNALSLQDNYWIKIDGDKRKWKDVDLRTNHLNEALMQIALHGTDISVTGKLLTPELTGQGAYAKSWIREDDGSLWLYKRGANGVTESRIEVMVSNILDNCNVPHVKYIAGESRDEYICKCRCITTDDLSILPAMDYESYCSRNDKQFMTEVLNIDYDMIYKMWIVDYLISNRDRHGMNWGFYFDSNTTDIIGCHPLFDHNNGFDIETMQNKDRPYLFDNGKTMKESALYAMKKVDFYFFREFTREDFLTERQYNSFKDRAKDLNIKVLGAEK